MESNVSALIYYGTPGTFNVSWKNIKFAEKVCPILIKTPIHCTGPRKKQSAAVFDRNLINISNLSVFVKACVLEAASCIHIKHGGISIKVFDD